MKNKKYTWQDGARNFWSYWRGVDLLSKILTVLIIIGIVIEILVNI